MTGQKFGDGTTTRLYNLPSGAVIPIVHHFPQMADKLSRSADLVVAHLARAEEIRRFEC
jgi:hypothetical protein